MWSFMTCSYRLFSVCIRVIPKSLYESSLSSQRHCLIAQFGASSAHLINNVIYWRAVMIWCVISKVSCLWWLQVQVKTDLHSPLPVDFGASHIYLSIIIYWGCFYNRQRSVCFFSHLLFFSQNNSSPWYQQLNSTMSSSSMQSLLVWTSPFPTPKRLLPWKGSWIR